MNKKRILRKVLELMGFKDEFNSYLTDTATTFEVDAVAAKLDISMSEWRQTFSVERVWDEAAELLKDEFESKELSAMMSFLRTKVGRAVWRKMPLFTEKLCEIAQECAEESAKKFADQKIDEHVARQKVGGGGLSGPSGAN